VSEQENERRALEQNALADFLATRGIKTDAPATASATAAPVAAGPVSKQMGPTGGKE